ncbi:ATP-binding protein [Spirosoma sp. SC4-14]|uniref:sensor histidine kinase n=1 Tax=Spirosoma sp. SC4-14 TaxID=3128900 RepID=UPI0030CC88F2
MKSLPMKPTENPALLRAALNHSGGGVMLFECLRTATGHIQDFRLIVANQFAESIVGMSEADMLNRLASELLPQLTALQEQAVEVVDTGKTVETELSVWSSAQSTNRWFRASLQKYGDGLALSLVDITSIRQETSLIEDVLNGSINGMIAYDALRDNNGNLYDLRVRLANEAAVRILGRSLPSLLNQTLRTLFPSVTTTGLFDRYKHTVDTGESQRFEFHYTHDGLNGWFDISICKLGDGMLLTFMDITSTKHYEQNLQNLIATLKQSNQNLERFAYVASHDLQEPLRKIQSFGDILLSQSEDSLGPSSLNLINRMQLAAQRMNTLIHDLLAFSRLSAEHQSFKRISLQQIVSDVLNDLEVAIHDKKAIIDVDSLPIIEGDRGQLYQLFQNLLSNSLKFIFPNTIARIRIDCKQLTGADIIPLPGQTVSGTDLNHLFYAIGVIDNGIGFDEKYLNQIFTVFQRLHTRSEYQGTGIGLSIVQKVAENHKGYISAHSKPGHGATFTVYLPVLEKQVSL